MNIWIIGCGDIGRRVSFLYKRHENKIIHGIVQSKTSKITCEQSGIITTIINLDKAYQLPKELLKNANVFYFAPPPSTGQTDPRLKSFLSAVEALPNRIVLISTTGVYGDSHGEWIDENTPPKPKADRAHRRLSAEQSLQGWAKQHNKEYMILRVPGIYAEDRLPLSRLKRGLAVVNENEAGWTNRIHADDLALACKASMQCNDSNQIINTTDGSPSSMTDYFNKIADYAELPRPPQIPMTEAETSLSKGMVSYLKESRRIRNEKLLSVLHIKLEYPNLRTFIDKKKHAK